MIRAISGTVFLCGFLLSAQPNGMEREVIDTVQKTFDAIAAKNEQALRKLFLPDARVIALRNGKLNDTSADQFAARVNSVTGSLLERMWNPKVMLHEGIAVLWAEYDFHRDGKFSHCGIDVANLVKTEEGWKISSIQYTAETEGCKPSPLGPPKP